MARFLLILKGCIACLLLTPLLAGCAASIQGAPDRLLPISEETELARKLASPTWYAEYATSTGLRRRELRDQIVLARMYAIDLYYSEYERQLTRERQNVGFFATVANLALTSTATLVGAKETKSILSAVATGLTGTREAYDKDILIEKTITILQQQMRTRRKAVRVLIIERLADDATMYPLELALMDIESYYRAGTITGALIDVSEATGVRLAQARAIEEQVVVTRFSPVSDLGQRIRNYFRQSLENRERVEVYLQRRHGSMPLAAFLRRGNRAEELRMIQELRIP